MKVCVLNENEAWFVEHEGTMPDHRFHWHWTLTRATDELMADRVRAAWRNGVVVPNVVVLPPPEPKDEDRAFATDWHPKMSDGSPVWQLITNPRR
jgi:hypothetical protein